MPTNEQPPSPGMTFPVIHLNGTSPRMLARGYSETIVAIDAAIDSIQSQEFHARDYYPVEGLWQKALAEHKARLESLREISRQFEALRDHCLDRIRR